MRSLPNEAMTRHLTSPYDDVHHERVRAHAKHDGNGQSMERKHFTSDAWIPVIVEEVGEASRELNELRHKMDAHAPVKMELIRAALALREELVQVAAMTVAWIEACDDYLSDNENIVKQLGNSHV